MPDLLIELLSEEIPARMQARAAEDLRRLMTDGMVEAGLAYRHATAHATPRRLALAVEGLADRSPDTAEERRGPRADAPDKAIEGFLRGAGVARDDLEARAEAKGTFLYATIRREGRAADAIVAEVLERTVRAFPWPKSMRWGDGTLRWVRPLRRILCLLSDEAGARVVPLEIDGIAAADLTEGHRSMAPGAFAVTGFEDYEAKLARAHVVLSAEARAEAIAHDARQAAFAAGLELVEDPALLAEVAGLVEWPVTLMGAIDAAFLDLPPEVLTASMKEHQKFFSVRDRGGRVTHFVTVANRETADDGATILAGNARVLSARLADAAFFWGNDLAVAKAGMQPWLDKLGNVTFHAKLGSQAERIDRIAALAREVAPALGADPEEAARAARLAKADLASEMVYEFPELQGVMGRYYALDAGEAEAVADAARDHYAPLGPSDDVPTAPVSAAVALADKLDLLTGMWAIGETPTGSKDPFALRRAALGVIRIALDAAERGHAPRLRPLAEAHLTRHGDGDEQEHEEEQGHAPALAQGRERTVNALLSFLHDRLKQHLRAEGVRHDVIDAVLTGERTDDLADVAARARALHAVLATDDGGNLIQGYKRAANILAQAEAADGVEYSYGGDPKLAKTDEERALFAALDAAGPRIDAALSAEDYPAAMAALAGLRAPIDAFFEAVQVNADNPIVRRNRLNLLSTIVRTCGRIADLSRVEG